MIYPKIKERMEELNLKTEDIAVMMMVSPQIAYDRLNGRSKFRPLECELLSRMLNTPQEVLFEEVRE